MNVPLTPIRFKKRAASLYGKKLGVVCGGLRLTYSEFSERCDRLSRALQALGIKPGDRVAFLAFNCHRLLEAYYGVVQMGAVLLPINIRLSRREFAYILNDSEARLLFFDSELKQSVAEIRSSLKSVEQFIPLDVPLEELWCSKSTYDDLLAATDAGPFEPVEPNEDDAAEIFYTSGTTANAKGVMLTHRNLYLHALGTIIATGIRDTDVVLHTIPLCHVNGWGTPQSLTCMGGTHIMMRRFDPAVVLPLIGQERVTFMSLVPAMANALLQHPDLAYYDYSSLRMINIGGAAPSLPMIRKMEEAFGCSCHTGYGLTETSPVLTLAVLKGTLHGLTREEKLRRQAMTGFAQVGVELRVVDEDGNHVRRDGQQIGEIIVRADGVMEGYWRQPEETARVVRGGWFHTGDMATIDDEGYVLIVDRKKDIIISGGENIASIEIERVLATHPSVLECAVIPVPDPQWGEVPKALVVLQPDSGATAEELLDHCRKWLARFKSPRSVDFFDTLPKGATGKILKRQLREQYWAGYPRRVQG